MASVIVRNSAGKTGRIFFDGKYPEECPVCSSDITIDGNGFTCDECEERFDLICSDEELKGGSENEN